MSSLTERHALYYPFHLCHEQTLHRMLTEYTSVHFRDYMAMQMTVMTGTTASADRMGDDYPDLVKTGRIVQGHSVSGPLDPVMVAAIDRDLADATWRSLFHGALLEDRRFQRGLFDLSHGMLIGTTMVPGPAALLRLTEGFRAHQPCSVETLRHLSRKRRGLDDGYEYEYSLALINTSASLAYTILLCIRHGLEAVTDSTGHYRLLARTCLRDHIDLRNRVLKREGY
jgi:hypothetical protein